MSQALRRHRFAVPAGRASRTGGLLAVMALAGAMAAGCGSQSAGLAAGGSSPPGQGSGAAAGHCAKLPAPPPGTSPRTRTVTRNDNGKSFCVPQGTRLAVYLHGTPARRWGPIRSASAALKPVPDGRLALQVGVTGAFFQAVHPGVARVTSAMQPCRPGVSGASGGQGSAGGGMAGSGSAEPAGPGCDTVVMFRVTLVVTR